MFDYSQALLRLKDGKLVARAGWNGKGMWLMLVRADEYAVGFSAMAELSGRPQFKREGQLYDFPYELLPWIGMKTADGKFVPWLCSQTDALAEDWELVA